jgi:hypothetical protein
MRNRITNFGDAKKNLGNMQFSRDAPTMEIRTQTRGRKQMMASFQGAIERGSQLAADGERSALKRLISLTSDRLSLSWEMTTTSATAQDAFVAMRLLGHPRGIATPPRSATTSV